MAKNRTAIEDILAIRRRTPRDISPADVPERLVALLELYQATDVSPPELLRYFPIGLVACLQGYFRHAVSALLDEDARYLDALSSSDLSRDLRIDLEQIAALYGSRLTIGDLVAIPFPCNSRSDISKVMSALLGKDFHEQMKTVRDRFAAGVEGRPARIMLFDAGRTFRAIDEVFRLRHIFAHELAPGEPVTDAGVGEMLQEGYVFLSAFAQLIADELHPEGPLTIEEMAQANVASATSADDRIASLLQDLVAASTPQDARSLSAAVHSWREYREQISEFIARNHRDTPIWPIVLQGSRADLGWEFLADLENLKAGIPANGP